MIHERSAADVVKQVFTAECLPGFGTVVSLRSTTATQSISLGHYRDDASEPCGRLAVEERSDTGGRADRD